VRAAHGLYPRANVTGYASSDFDAALADLHYCDVADYAVGCNTSAGWAPAEDGVVRAAHTDFLPAAEVERSAKGGWGGCELLPSRMRGGQGGQGGLATSALRRGRRPA
jgi:hypothetical protein